MRRMGGLAALFALTVSLVCAGCGAEAGSGAVTLQTASMFGEGDSAGPAYQELIAAYQTAHPGVTVEDASEVSSEAWKKGVLERFEQEETTPDVLFFFTGADVRSLILNDQLVSVEEIREAYPDYGADIRESAMAQMREFDGECYAVPVKGIWEGLFCNRDLFERYGAPLPTDWEAFQTAVRIFADNGVIPIAASLKEVPHYWIEHLILSEGGAVEHRLNPKDYIPDSWVRGIGWFRTLYRQSAFPPDTFTMDNASSTALFLEKQAAMTLDGSWLVQSVTDVDHTVVLPFPTAPGGKMQAGDVISGYSSGFYLTRRAWEDPSRREAAVEFVRFMTRAESVAALCAMGGAPAMDIPRTGTDSALQQSVNAIQENTQNACMPIDSKVYKDAWNALCADIPAVAQGNITALEAVRRLSQGNRW